MPHFAVSSLPFRKISLPNIALPKAVTEKAKNIRKKSPIFRLPPFKQKVLLLGAFGALLFLGFALFQEQLNKLPEEAQTALENAKAMQIQGENALTRTFPASLGIGCPLYSKGGTR
jgi:hypothetical protein